MCQMIAVNAESRFAPQYCPGLGCKRFLSFCFGNHLVDSCEGFFQVGQKLGFGLGRIWATKMATGGRLFSRYLFCPRFIGTSHVLYLLAKGADILELALRRLEIPFVFRHSFSQRG